MSNLVKTELKIAYKVLKMCRIDGGMSQKYVSNHRKCLSYTWDVFIQQEPHFIAISHVFMRFHMEMHKVQPSPTRFLQCRYENNVNLKNSTLG